MVDAGPHGGDQPEEVAPTNLVKVEHLGKTFGGVRAVQDLTFTAEPGTITGFLGPNGAGKTTTLRALLGLVRADSGRALIGGRRYVDLERPAVEVGAVLEATGFHPDRTARNHLRAVCMATRLPRRRVDESLDLVELTAVADLAVRGFSFGMRQRLALATAIVGRPKVLIVDEPANGLDPAGVRWLRGFLRDLADAGCTVLVSSHALSEVEQIADHVVIIAAGRLLRDAPLAELTGEGRGPGLEEVFVALTTGDGTPRDSGAGLWPGPQTTGGRQ